MNCIDYQAQFDDYLDNSLEAVARGNLEQHLGCCDACSKMMENEQQFRAHLSEAAKIAIPYGIERRAFTRLRQQLDTGKKDLHAVSFWTGFGSAIPAAILLFVLIGFFGDTFKSGPEIDQGITMSLYEPRKVKMVFDVPEAVAEATFSMQLPEHIVIAGTDNIHQLEWKAALKKGKNLLSLPIVAQAAKSGELVAKIRFGSKEKVFKLKLDIVPAEIEPVQKGEIRVSDQGIV